MNLNESQIAMIEAANIALGKLPETCGEWNELVWKVFDAGIKYGAAALREENARKQAYIDKLEGRISVL